MTKEDFLANGFTEEQDPIFRFRKELIDEEVIEEQGLNEDDIPCLLFGNTGINKGFCVYTGMHFIRINATTIEDAIEFSKKIVAFESA